MKKEIDDIQTYIEKLEDIEKNGDNSKYYVEHKNGEVIIKEKIIEDPSNNKYTTWTIITVIVLAIFSGLQQLFNYFSN